MREEEEYFIIIFSLSPAYLIKYLNMEWQQSPGHSAVRIPSVKLESRSENLFEIILNFTLASPHTKSITNSLRYHFIHAARWPLSLVLTHQNNRLSNREGDERQRLGAGDGSRPQGRRGFPAGRHRSEVNVVIPCRNCQNTTVSKKKGSSWFKDY